MWQLLWAFQLCYFVAAILCYLQVLLRAEQRQLPGRRRVRQLCLRHLLHGRSHPISSYGDLFQSSKPPKFHSLSNIYKSLSKVILFILWLVVLFISLAVAADDYFCPAIEIISKTLRFASRNSFLFFYIAWVTIIALFYSKFKILSFISDFKSECCSGCHRTLPG